MPQVYQPQLLILSQYVVNRKYPTTGSVWKINQHHLRLSVNPPKLGKFSVDL